MSTTGLWRLANSNLACHRQRWSQSWVPCVLASVPRSPNPLLRPRETFRSTFRPMLLGEASPTSPETFARSRACDVMCSPDKQASYSLFTATGRAWVSCHACIKASFLAFHLLHPLLASFASHLLPKIRKPFVVSSSASSYLSQTLAIGDMLLSVS